MEKRGLAPGLIVTLGAATTPAESKTSILSVATSGYEASSQPALRRVLRVHAVSSIDDVQGAADIYAIDAGLASLRKNGEWLEVVKEHYLGADLDRHHHNEIAPQ